MPEPQIVIVVNSLTEAHKLERELVRDRQNACGYRPRQKDECRFCKHVGRYSSYTYQTTYFCDLHNFCVAARGICNDFETNIPGGEPMTAQEWLDELERLRKAATPGPWEAWRYNAGFVRISTCPLDPDDDEVIKVADSPDITASDAAYIVAACNAVPRLVEMLVFLASLASEDDESVDAIERRIQWAYNETRPKE